VKALVLKDYKKFVYENVPRPKIGPEEVLIRVKACAICGSDVHGMDGGTGRRMPPIIMGHEAAGVIDEVGNNVKGFNPGDRVTFDSTIYCGRCYYCFNGKVNLCDNRRVLGVSCQEYRQNGAFAEYVAVPQHILYKIPDTLSFERAAMVEPLSIALHALNRTHLRLNDNAVVVGAGMIGLLLIQLLANAGCSKVIAVDIDRNKLELAKKFGAFMTIGADGENIEREIYAATGNRGADISFEAVGISATLNTAIKCLKKGGISTIVGNLSPTVELPLQLIVTGEITLNGSCASAGEYERCLDMIARGVVDIDTFISAVAPLEEGAVWFKRLYDKEPGLMKVILNP
jgi:L-iditol 2-dehydrogenase